MKKSSGSTKISEQTQQLTQSLFADYDTDGHPHLPTPPLRVAELSGKDKSSSLSIRTF